MKRFPILLLIASLQMNVYALDKPKDNPDISAQKVILKYTGDKLDPQKLELNKLDSSVFVLNQSESKDIFLEIDFREKKIHCHSANLKLDNGYLKTQSPIKPRDFEILCFPTPGIYKYIVKETGKNSKELRGEILINE